MLPSFQEYSICEDTGNTLWGNNCIGLSSKKRRVS